MPSLAMSFPPVEELAAPAHRADALDEQIEVAVVVHEVEFLGIHDQDGTPVEVIEETAVAVGERGKIFRADRTLEFYAPPAHALIERGRLRLQVDDQVGPRGLGLERVEYLLVQVQLVAREREAREKRVLFQEEIAHGQPVEQVHLRELAQLADPLEQEKKLRRQGEARHVLVKARQERILLGVLEDQGRPQPSGEAPGEAGLADADRPFDDDVVIFGKRHGRLAINGAHDTQHAPEVVRADNNPRPLRGRPRQAPARLTRLAWRAHDLSQRSLRRAQGERRSGTRTRADKPDFLLLESREGNRYEDGLTTDGPAHPPGVQEPESHHARSSEAMSRDLAGSSVSSPRSGSAHRRRISVRVRFLSSIAPFQSAPAGSSGALKVALTAPRRNSHWPSRSTERVPRKVSGTTGAPACAATANAPILKGSRPGARRNVPSGNTMRERPARTASTKRPVSSTPRSTSNLSTNSVPMRLR